MKPRFYIEQLEPRILLSGDILSELVPLLSSREASQMQSDYLLEHPEARRVAPLSAVEAARACMVVVQSEAPSLLTEDGLMYPFEVGVGEERSSEANAEPTLAADFSADYTFSKSEWDALEDGWRNLSSMVGDTLLDENLVAVESLLSGGSRLYGGDELAALLQQPIDEYGSVFAQSSKGVLEALTQEWRNGDLVVVGKVLGGYNQSTNEVRFDLSLQTVQHGRTFIDGKEVQVEGMSVTLSGDSSFSIRAELEVSFGINLLTNSFFADEVEGLVEFTVEASELEATVTYAAPTGEVVSDGDGNLRLEASFMVASSVEHVVADNAVPALTATPQASGMELTLSFAGDEVHQGIEGLTIIDADLFTDNALEVTLQGGHLHPWESGLTAANLYVGTGDVLAGSGTFAGDLYNAGGIVAPGNSPGRESVSTFTQLAGGTLLIELQGKSTAGVDYDWLDIAGAANFGGTLQVELLNGYKPTVGDTFDIITFGGSASGIFTNLSGLYGFDSDHYFDVVQSANKIQLVTKEIIAGDTFSFATDALGSAYNSQLGMLLNASYLTSAAPTSVSLSGDLNLGDGFQLGGSFTFAKETVPSTITLSDSSTVSATSLKISGENLHALFGTPAEGAGVSFSDVDFAFARFTPVSTSDSRSWIVTKGSVGTDGDASFVNLGDLSITAGTISFDISQGLGAGNTTVANLSSSPITLGSVTLNSNGSRGEYFDVAASGFGFSVADTVAVTGDFLFSSDGARLAAVGSHVSAHFGTAEMYVGVTDATVALMSSKTQGTVLQALGGFAASLGSDISLSATSSSILWKEAGTTVLTDVNKTLTIGSSSFTFSQELVDAITLQEVRVSGAELRVGNFVAASGDLAFHKTTTNVYVSGTTTAVHADVLTLGASGLSIFVGTNGADEANRMGLSVSGADFALAIIREQAGAARQWTALKGSAESAAALGMPDVTLSGSTISLELNLQASDASVLDFSTQSLAVATGVGSSVTLDFDEALVRASGEFDIAIADFLELSGSMAFEKQSQQLAVQAADGTSSNILMDLLTLGGAGIEAFVGMNGGAAEQVGLVLAGTRFALLMAQEKAVAKRKWSALKADADSAALVGIENLTLAGSELSVAINQSNSDGSLLDFSTTSYAVPVGPSETLALDFNADAGELLQASGNLEIDLFGFVQLSGDVAFQKSISTVTLADEASTSVAVEMVTFGGHDLNAFAGINGGSEEAIGLELGGVEFGLALMTSTSDAARTWTSLQASAESAAFVGVEASGGLTLSGDTLSVVINQSSLDGDSVVDYSAGKTDLTIATGTSTSMQFAMEGSQGEMLAASGNLSLDVFGFFQAEGGFAIEKRTDTLLLSDATDTTPASQIAVDLLTIGGSGINAFAGLNGGSDEALGLALGDVNFGLMLATEQGGAQRQFTSLKADAGSIEFVGLDGFVASGTNVVVEINRGVAGVGEAAAVVADHGAMPLLVTTSPDSSIELDMDGAKGEITRASGAIDLNLYNFFSLHGELAFEQSTSSITLANNPDTTDVNEAASPVTVNLLTIGGKNVSAFVGMNGARDSEGALSDDAFGIDLDTATFGVAVMTEKGGAARSWSSVQATASGLSFVGIDGLTVAGSELSVAINQSAADGSVVDYSSGKTEMTIATGSDDTSTLSLNMDGSKGDTIQASGRLDINLFDFFTVEGYFAFEKSRGAVTLSDGDVIEQADLLTLGGNDVSAFVGINGGSADELGLELGTADFALALITDSADATRKFTSLQASAALASFVGVDGLKVEAKDLAVNINKGITLPATPEVITKVNTILSLELPASLIGKLTLSKGSDTADVALNGKQSSEEIIALLTAAFASLEGIGADNVQVSGNSIDGYKVEFVGELAGVDVTGITVNATAAPITTSVNTVSEAQNGVTEVKQIVVESLVGEQVPVTVDVSQVTQGVAGQSEINSIIFTNPSTSGSYSVFLSANGTVTNGSSAVAGVNGVQRLTLDALGGEPSSATATITEEVAASSISTSEILAINFTVPNNNSGKYTLSTATRSVDINFVGNDVTNNARYLREGLAKLLKTSEINISVSFDKTFYEDGGTLHTNIGHSYNIYFRGALATTDIPTISVNKGTVSGDVILTAKQQGGPARSETQRVSLETSGEGTFILSLLYEGKTYQTKSLAFGATADKVQVALNAALMNISGTTKVTLDAATGDYLVTFGGNLQNKNINMLSATLQPASTAPEGSFTLLLGGVTSSAITYSSNATTMASRLQSALAAMSNVASGNVTVAVDAAHSVGSATAFSITFKGALAGSNVEVLAINDGALSGVDATMQTVTNGVASVGETQRILVGSHPQSVGYTLALEYNGRTYNSGSIASGATQSAVQAALTAGFSTLSGADVQISSWTSATDYTIRFGGSLAGKDVALVAIKPNVEPTTAAVTGTGNFVVGNTAQNVANLKAAYATMLSTNQANISVSYDPTYSGGGERYLVSFVDAFANTDLPDKSFLYSSNAIGYKLIQDGSAPIAEVQRVAVDKGTSTGTFVLQFTHNSTTVTTSALAFDASAATVQSALNTALANISGATASVALDSDGAYLVTFGGTLLGKNVANLKATNIAVDPILPSGNFTIELNGLNGQMSSAIAYSTNNATLAASLQSALEGLGDIGAGNVSVSYSATESTSKKSVFTITFKGEKVATNIPDITAHFGDLERATVTPYRITEGQEVTAEVQRVTLDTIAEEGSFILSLTHGGSTYKTASIALQATKDEVQAAVSAAFAGLASAEVTVESWTQEELTLSFGGSSLAGQNIAPIVVNATVAPVSAALASVQAGYTEVQEAEPIRTLVVDYSAGKTDLTVTTGPSSSMKLTMDGSKGELLQASGDLTLDVYGFFMVEGNLALEKSESSVTLNDSEVAADGTVTKPASQVNVNLLTIGGSGLKAFAGINGAYDEDGELVADAVGLSLTDTSFGLVMAGEQATGLEPAGTTMRKWTSLQAEVGGASFEGIEGLKVSVDTLGVEINRVAMDGSLIDYKAQNVAINTGTEANPSSMSLTMDGSEGALLRATGNLNVDIFGFVQVSGSFGIEKKSGAVTLADIEATEDVDESLAPVSVDMLLLGASGVDAFVGAGDVGLALSDVNIGLALLTEQLPTGSTALARKWTSVEAEVGSAGLVGIEASGGLTAQVEELSVSINRAAVDTSVVDYSLKAGSTTVRKTDLTILTGPLSDMALTMDGSRGALLEANGRLVLDVFGFVQAEGEFAIEKASALETITLSNATTTEAEVLRLGAHDLRAFAGINGGTDDAIGLELTGVDFALALVSEKPATGSTTQPRSWTSLQATAESAAFVGVDGLTAQADTIAITVNKASTDGLVVDYSLKTEGGTERKTAMTVRTGISEESAITFDMDGAEGNLLRASANLELDLFGFFQVSGGFAIEKKTAEVVLNDGVVSEDATKAKAPTELSVDLLTIGGSGVDAFAGMNGGTADAIGLQLSDVEFGLALMTEQVEEGSTAAARKFTTLKANAGEISFVGVDGITASATDLSVEINRGIAGTAGNPDVVVDFGYRQLEVLSSPDSTIVLDSDGSLGQLMRASGTLDFNLYNFVSLNGNFAIESSSKEIHLAGADNATAGEVVQANMLAIGGSEVNAFVGINGGTDDAIGLQLAKAEFGLALLSDKDDATRSWTTLEANAEELSFVGIEGLTASAKDITISINQAGKLNDKVVDYVGTGATATDLTIKTGQSSDLKLSQEGSEGETLKAAGNLDIDMFGFFSVKGGFAVEQRSQEVTLSDGTVIKNADLITIGANEVDAFAGVNGGFDDKTGELNGDAMGVSLGDVNFALALISDPSDKARSFTSLQATAADVGVEGIEGLTMQVNEMLVNINHGITVQAEPAKTIKVNTQLKLNVPVDLIGTLTFNRTAGTGYAADSAVVNVTANMTNDALITALTTGIESFDGIGAGNVQVTGNRYDGYVIEFIGTLSGINIDDITVSAAGAGVTYGVTTTTAANAGVNEVKELTVQALREAPAPVAITIGTESDGRAGVNEANEIIFTTPKSAGTYTVYFVTDGLVQQTTAGVTGVSEVQRLSLTGDTTAAGGSGSVTVTTVTEGSGSAVVNERYVETFTKEFGRQGFKLFFVDNPKLSVTWDYTNYAEDTSATIGDLKSAYAELLNGYQSKTVTVSDIQVSIDNSYKGSGHRYNVEFVGALAGVDVKAIGMRSEAGSFSHVNKQDGISGTSEVQKVVLNATGSGYFTLSLTYNSKSFTTDGIAFGASAATVRYALNAALGRDGSVEVSSPAKGEYLISFGGKLAGQNISALTGSTLSEAPSGNFTLSFGGQTTRSISYTTDGSALASRVQTELARLSNIGSGNVKVSYNASQSNDALLGLDIRFTGTLANQNVNAITVDGSNLANAGGSVRTITQGVANINQVQTITLGTDAVAKGYRLSLSYLGETYTTNLIAGNASATAIQSAINQRIWSHQWCIVQREQERYTSSANGWRQLIRSIVEPHQLASRGCNSKRLPSNQELCGQQRYNQCCQLESCVC